MIKILQKNFRKFQKLMKYIDLNSNFNFYRWKNNNFLLKVLSDESKRKQYDTFGMNTEQSGGSQAYNQNKNNYQYYQSQVDPEELFRYTI